MRGGMERLFARCGTPARLNGTPVRVFFLSRRSWSLERLQRVMKPLGQVPQGRYMCYFPAECSVAQGDILELDTGSYVLCQAEAVLGIGGQVLCRWALCRRKGGEPL